MDLDQLFVQTGGQKEILFFFFNSANIIDHCVAEFQDGAPRLLASGVDSSCSIKHSSGYCYEGIFADVIKVHSQLSGSDLS